MGLDQYGLTYPMEQAGNQETDIRGDGEDCIYQWRKHPNLHGWMENLYRAKGGQETQFNCATVRLDSADLDTLEKAVLAGKLPVTEGFFFGQSRPENKAQDLEFIARARDAIQRGLVVFYDSWW